MDDENYANYIARKSFRYFGGLCRKGFPSLTKPPAAGDWNIVVTPIPATAPLSPAIQIVDS